MSILGLVILLVIVGAALYLLQLVPMDATIRTVLKVVIITVLIVYAIIFLAGLAGLSTGLPGVRTR